MSERVFIIGAGRVGQGLARAFRVSGVEIVGVHGRRPSDFATSSGALPRTIGDANTVIVAVRDEQMDGILSELSSGAPNKPLLAAGTVVLHTSGTADPPALGALAQLGASCGTFHPLVPFVHPDRAPEQLRGAWIGIDGDGDARSAARRLAGHLGARTLDIPPGHKSAYHAAAVFAANFPVVLAALGAELLESIGVPERSADGAIESLMRAAVANISGGSPLAALTGPIVRGDVEMVQKNLAALRKNERFLAVYRRLSLAALPLAAQRGTDPAALAEIERALRGSA